MRQIFLLVKEDT